MQTLFLIDGAAGTGKTDILDYVREKYPGGKQVHVMTKFTTRARRPEEISGKLSIDLEFVTEQQFIESQKTPGFYFYGYGGALYGFLRADIDRALQIYKTVFIIVRNRAVIQQIVLDYPSVCVVPVFIYTDREQCCKRLSADGYDNNAVEFRLGRQELASNDYLKHSTLYREVIINNSTRTDLQRLVDSLLGKYSPDNEPSNMLVITNSDRFTLLRSLIGFKHAIQAKAANYQRNVFLMMRFRDSNRLVYEFIHKQLSNVGFQCVRADQPEWNITHDVYNPLAVLYCCKYGIALFDEPEEGNNFSPNVAYELSMMHLQGKECLILGHASLPNMPFDLVKDVHMTYSRELELEKIVRDWISGIG